MNWNKGRGKLGVFKPLLGGWTCTTETAMGVITCERHFEPTLNNKYIQLIARWQLPKSEYIEHCLFGVNKTKDIAFWSFTSDGKQSNGLQHDASDVSAQHLAFAAQMDAGFARQIYWPDAESDCIHWAVESQTKKGWNRFTQHQYHKLD